MFFAVFFASDISTFLCFCKGKIAKESRPRPLFKKGVCGLYQNGGIFAFEAKMLPTNDI